MSITAPASEWCGDPVPSLPGYSDDRHDAPLKTPQARRGWRSRASAGSATPPRYALGTHVSRMLPDMPRNILPLDLAHMLDNIVRNRDAHFHMPTFVD